MTSARLSQSSNRSFPLTEWDTPSSVELGHCLVKQAAIEGLADFPLRWGRGRFIETKDVFQEKRVRTIQQRLKP